MKRESAPTSQSWSSMLTILVLPLIPLIVLRWLLDGVR